MSNVDSIALETVRGGTGPWMSAADAAKINQSCLRGEPPYGASDYNRCLKPEWKGKFHFWSGNPWTDSAYLQRHPQVQKTPGSAGDVIP